MKIDLISTHALSAIQLIYTAKTECLEFDTVWIVGQEERHCELLTDYSQIGLFNLRFIADHSSTELIESIKRRSVDLLLQVGSKMIGKELVSAPSIGVLNLHAGMLPRYRGLDSAMWAVLEDGVHGVSAHLLNPGVDTGPIILTDAIPFVAGETIPLLLARTHNKYKWQIFVRAACALRDRKLQPQPQKKEDGKQYFALHPKLAEAAKELLSKVS